MLSRTKLPFQKKEGFDKWGGVNGYFKGSFNIRLGTDLHRRVALEAIQRGINLNSVVKEALEQYLK